MLFNQLMHNELIMKPEIINPATIAKLAETKMSSKKSKTVPITINIEPKIKILI
ncbi:MAG: hypothetical protein ACW981_12030 [Candidatus Hodarchaeales archaeon]